MVRYTKNKGARPYRRFPGFKSTKHMSAVLASLNPEQFGVLQQYARHFLGTDVIPGVPEHNSSKILPSSYQTIVDTTFPKALNAQLVSEEEQHNNHQAESHMGGGLGSAIQVVASTAWDQLKAQGIPGQAVSWLEEKLLNPLHGEELTQDDQQNADLLGCRRRSRETD